MSKNEFSIDPEECEIAYQQIVEREAFDDLFEQYRGQQEDSYLGGPEFDPSKGFPFDNFDYGGLIALWGQQRQHIVRAAVIASQSSSDAALLNNFPPTATLAAQIVEYEQKVRALEGRNQQLELEVEQLLRTLIAINLDSPTDDYNWDDVTEAMMIQADHPTRQLDHGRA